MLVTCPVEGQFYTANCYGENATCSDPNPGLLCNRPQCVCPRGQVIDADGKTCINGTECSKYIIILNMKLLSSKLTEVEINLCCKKKRAKK